MEKGRTRKSNSLQMERRSIAVKKSVDLNPADQLTVDMFFSKLLGRIQMNQHEVEFGFPYDGDPQRDLELIVEAESYLKYLLDLSRREVLNSQLEELKQVALKAIKK